MIQALNTQQFLKYADDQNFEAFYFFDYTLKEITTSTNPFYRLKCEEGKVQEPLKEFCNRYQQRFKVLCFRKKMNYDAATTCPVDLRADLNGTGSTTHTMNEDWIQSQINSGIESYKQGLLIEEKNDEIERMRGWEYKFHSVIDRVFLWLATKNPGQMPPNGMHAMQGHPQQQTQHMTEPSADETKQALQRLIDILGKERLVKMANKIQPNDPALMFLDNWINS